MAVNMDKIRARYEALNSKGGSNFWKPKDGETDIRILPPPGEDPFVDFFLHYKVGNTPGFLCPKLNFGEDCPVCNFANSLYNEGDEDSTKLAKQLFPRQRLYTAVLVRGESTESPKIWSFGKTAYENMIELFLNKDYGDLSDAETGTDLTIKYGKAPGMRFPSTTITPRRKSSPMLDDMSKVSAVLDAYPDLNSIHQKKSADEVRVILESFLEGSDVAAENNSSETVQYGKSAEDVLTAKLDQLAE